jgi:hypothetical protein
MSLVKHRVQWLALRNSVMYLKIPEAFLSLLSAYLVFKNPSPRSWFEYDNLIDTECAIYNATQGTAIYYGTEMRSEDVHPV